MSSVWSSTFVLIGALSAAVIGLVSYALVTVCMPGTRPRQRAGDGALMIQSSRRRGGCQSVEWSVKALTSDDDGDFAHEFIGPIQRRTSHEAKTPT